MANGLGKGKNSVSELVRWAILLQISVLPLSLLLLDCGGTFGVCICLMVVHWVHALYVILRRGSRLTRRDRVLIQYGFFFLLAAYFVMVALL